MKYLHDCRHAYLTGSHVIRYTIYLCGQLIHETTFHHVKGTVRLIF